MVNEVWIEVTPDLPWWVDGCLYTFIVRMFIVLIPHTHSVLKSYLPVYNMENGSALTYVLMSVPTTAYKEKRCICIPASHPPPNLHVYASTLPLAMSSLVGPYCFQGNLQSWGKRIGSGNGKARQNAGKQQALRILVYAPPAGPLRVHLSVKLGRQTRMVLTPTAWVAMTFWMNTNFPKGINIKCVLGVVMFQWQCF